MCQKASGGPFMAFAGVPLADLVWTSGRQRPSQVRRSPSAASAAPAARPSPTAWSVGDRISITLGSLDRPSEVRPRMQYGLESKVAWLDRVAGLPHRDIAPLFAPGVRVEPRQHPDHDT